MAPLSPNSTQGSRMPQKQRPHTQQHPTRTGELQRPHTQQHPTQTGDRSYHSHGAGAQGLEDERKWRRFDLSPVLCVVLLQCYATAYLNCSPLELYSSLKIRAYFLAVAEEVASSPSDALLDQSRQQSHVTFDHTHEHDQRQRRRQEAESWGGSSGQRERWQERAGLSRSGSGEEGGASGELSGAGRAAKAAGSINDPQEQEQEQEQGKIGDLEGTRIAEPLDETLLAAMRSA